MHTPMLSLLFVLSLLVSSHLCDYPRNAGQSIAIMTNGDITDFGWSSGVNKGRVMTERLLNISGTVFVPNIHTPEKAVKEMYDLVARGFRLIISATAAHGTSVESVASKFPNVTFVQTGLVRSSLPNLSTISWSAQELYFAIGVFAGAMTRNNRVGFIHPGPSVGPIASLNGFFTGVKWANTNANVYTVFIDSYRNPDRANGAAKILLNEQNVDILVGQQEDFSVAYDAIGAGLVGVGTTGFSAGAIIGEAIGTSMIRDWTSLLTTYVQGVLDAADASYKFDYAAGFRTNNTYFDIPSYRVTPAAWSTVVAGVALLASGETPYYCNSWVNEWGVNTTTNCLANTALFDQRIISDINQLGYYFVPLDEKDFPHSTYVAIVTLSALLLAFTVIIGAAVVYLRETTAILAARIVFLFLVLVGCAIVYVGAIVWPSHPSMSVCSARIWLPSLGATLAVGALVIKNVRIWIIYDNAHKCKRIHITDMELLGCTAILVLINLILLIVYTEIGHPDRSYIQGVEGLSTYEIRAICSTNKTGDGILWAILAFHISQFAVGCFVSFKIRNVNVEEFNECQPIGLCIYVVSLCMIIIGLLIGVTDSTRVQTVILVSFSLLFCTTAVIVVLFIPKIFTSNYTGQIVTRFIPRYRGGTGTTATATATESEMAPATANVAKPRTYGSESSVVISDNNNKGSVNGESKENQV